MARFRVAITDYPWPDVEFERELLAASEAELVDAKHMSERALLAAAPELDAILAAWRPVTAGLLAAATKCRIVARIGIGLDNIDVDACTRHGILVTNVPDYCRTEVAEHTLALIFALLRRVAHCHYETKQGRYSLSATQAPERVAGKVLGVVGLGTIGVKVAELARAVGMRVLGYRRSQAPLPEGVERVGWDELLATSDIITLHVPLEPSTRHIIGAAELACLKPTAYLINTSRGGLIDHRALADALATNRVAGAALDVQDPEPPELAQPPYNDPRVIVTPHIAFVSPESLLTLRQTSVEQVCEVLRGETPRNVVNPAVLPTK